MIECSSPMCRHITPLSTDDKKISKSTLLSYYGLLVRVLVLEPAESKYVDIRIAINLLESVLSFDGADNNNNNHSSSSSSNSSSSAEQPATMCVCWCMKLIDVTNRLLVAIQHKDIAQTLVFMETTLRAHLNNRVEVYRRKQVTRLDVHMIPAYDQLEISINSEAHKKYKQYVHTHSSQTNDDDNDHHRTFSRNKRPRHNHYHADEAAAAAASDIRMDN